MFIKLEGLQWASIWEYYGENLTPVYSLCCGEKWVTMLFNFKGCCWTRMSGIECLMQYNRWGPFSENLIYLLRLAIWGKYIPTVQYSCQWNCYKCLNHRSRFSLWYNFSDERLWMIWCDYLMPESSALVSGFLSKEHAHSRHNPQSIVVCANRQIGYWAIPWCH